jgi:hypothetical protein
MNRLLLFLIIVSANAFGQGSYPSGARSMSMANASVTFNDVWAHFNNPGAVGNINELTAGISYENRFLLKELQSQSLAVVIPLKVGAISVGGQMFGYRDFRSYKGGVGYGMQLGEKLFAGVQMNYLGIQLNNAYGSKNGIGGDLGILGKITDNWLIGFSVANLFRSKLTEFQDDRMTTLMRFGSSYRLSEKAMVTGEVEKDVENPMRFKAGVEYKPFEQFSLRGGVATAPIELSFGVGYQTKIISINVGSSFHQILGWSPHFGLIYSKL